MAQIKDLKRMCESYKTCDDCPLFRNNCFVIKPIGKIDGIVDKWVKEHTAKTYMQDFFEKFPNAMKATNGRPGFCRGFIYGNEPECPDGGCKECWNQEMKENA